MVALWHKNPGLDCGPSSACSQWLPAHTARSLRTSTEKTMIECDVFFFTQQQIEFVTPGNGYKHYCDSSGAAFVCAKASFVQPQFCDELCFLLKNLGAAA